MPDKNEVKDTYPSKVGLMVTAATGTPVRVVTVIHDLLHEGGLMPHLGHLVHLGHLGQGGAGLHGADDGHEDQQGQSWERDKNNYDKIFIESMLTSLHCHC